MLLEFIVGGIVGIIYYLIICQMSTNIFLIKPDSTMIQNSILFLYFGGLIGVAIGTLSEKNHAIKIGLYFGSSLLIFNAMIVNWDNMSNDTKLLLLGINFGLIIWYSLRKTAKNREIEIETETDTESEENL